MELNWNHHSNEDDLIRVHASDSISKDFLWMMLFHSMRDWLQWEGERTVENMMKAKEYCSYLVYSLSMVSMELNDHW